MVHANSRVINAGRPELGHLQNIGAKRRVPITRSKSEEITNTSNFGNDTFQTPTSLCILILQTPLFVLQNDYPRTVHLENKETKIEGGRRKDNAVIEYSSGGPCEHLSRRGLYAARKRVTLANVSGEYFAITAETSWGRAHTAILHLARTRARNNRLPSTILSAGILIL